MKLSKRDADLFFDLWFPLLEYVNRKYQIDTDIEKITRKSGIKPASAMNIANKLWEDTSVIDEYIIENELSDEAKKILRSWHCSITGTFVIERHLKKGTIIIDDDNVYLVKGLTQSIRDLTYDFQPPFFVQTTLMPFKNSIVTDGFIVPDVNMVIGDYMCSALKATYREARRNNWIIEKLNVNLIAENKKLLKIFEGDISNLKQKTIDTHLKIAEWYMNYYLMVNDLTMEEGVKNLDEFFYNEVIGNLGEIKQICKSIKKFYYSMFRHGIISKSSYNALCAEIKENLPRWAEECIYFNC